MHRATFHTPCINAPSLCTQRMNAHEACGAAGRAAPHEQKCHRTAPHMATWGAVRTAGLEAEGEPLQPAAICLMGRSHSSRVQGHSPALATETPAWLAAQALL